MRAPEPATKALLFTMMLALAAAHTEAQPAAAASHTTAPLTTWPVAPRPLSAEDLNAWLDGYLPYALHSGDIAGAEVAVVKDGEILTLRGYGYAELDKHLPVDPRTTLFRTGSVSKLVTWTAVMQLVEQGKIDLDRDINAYLDFKIPPRDGKPITMRNLMQHVAGFEESLKGLIGTDPQAPSFETLLKQWVPQRVFAAGTTPAYSNYGAALAGYIVERVSGEEFDDYLDRHIFAPLDMRHSTFRQPLPAGLGPLMSRGYERASSAPRAFEIVGPAPAGAMSASAEDMAHFMIAHLQDGEYQGRRILRTATAELMHDSALTLIPPLDRMELGFFETNINGREVIAHLGDTNDFHSALHLFLKENVGFYVAFNSLGREGAAENLRLALFEDFADRYFPASSSAAGASTAAASSAVDAATAAHDAALMAGRWVSSRGTQSNFLCALGLFLQASLDVGNHAELVTSFPGLNAEPRHWIEVLPFVWRDTASHMRLAASVVAGKPVRFSFDELAPFTVFDRPPWYRDGAWLMPLLWLSLAVLALTALGWPVTALVRRSYGYRLPLQVGSRRAYRASKIASIGILAAAASWAATLGLMFDDLSNLSARTDWLVRADQLVAMLGFMGGAGLILWNLVSVWRSPARRWPAKLWSIALAIAAGSVLWVAAAFRLLGFGVDY